MTADVYRGRGPSTTTVRGSDDDWAKAGFVRRRRLRRRKVLWAALTAVTLILGTLPALTNAASSAQQPGENLLKNPGFEGITCRPGSEPGWCLDNWTRDAHDDIFTPQGWVTWWRKGGEYVQPEVKTIPNVAPYTGELPRIRSGNYAVFLLNMWRLQDAGLYQVVTGIEPGTMVQFSAHAHGWSCDSDQDMGYSCGDPWNQWFQVGIEPNGVADPFSPGVAWSADQLSADHYSLIGPISAQVGAGSSVCVFLRSQTKWGYKFQGAYWDDASLVVTTPGSTPTRTPTPTPTDTPTPSPMPMNLVSCVSEPGEDIPEFVDMREACIGQEDGSLIFMMTFASAPPASPEEYIGYLWVLDLDRSASTGWQDGSISSEHIIRIAYGPDPSHTQNFVWHGHVDAMVPGRLPKGPLDGFRFKGESLEFRVPLTLLGWPTAFNRIAGLAYEGARDRVPNHGHETMIITEP